RERKRPEAKPGVLRSLTLAAPHFPYSVELFSLGRGLVEKTSALDGVPMRRSPAGFSSVGVPCRDGVSGMNGAELDLLFCRLRRRPAPALDGSVVPVAGDIGQLGAHLQARRLPSPKS